MKPSAPLVLAAVIVATMVAGCAGTANPTASPTELAGATASPTPEPTTVATASPTPGPTVIPYPGPPIPQGTLAIEIGADPHDKFDRTAMAAPADTPFVIAFDNRDTYACVPDCPFTTSITGHAHNVAIKLGGDLLFNPLPVLPAPAKADYFISEGLPAGTYQFVCIIHPAMHGMLTIK